MEGFLTDEDLGTISIEPTSNKHDAEKLDFSMETEDFDMYERSTNTTLFAEAEAQTEHQRPAELRVSKKSIIRFLEATVPLMCMYLEKSTTSRAFDSYDV
jgi:WD40 repeat protein